jgi:4-hydroxybenzoate polyprenyltransferase
MAKAQPGWQSFLIFLQMIKFEHSIFALPFAMTGMVWATVQKDGSLFPGWKTFGLILLAMVSCRSAAMAFNRILDRHIDAKNPRTAMRAIPAGLLSLRQSNVFFFSFVVLFLWSAWALNPLSFTLSPIALLFTLGYSYTKRFTPLCHLVLGASLAIAPAAAFIGVTGSLDVRILPLVAGVLLWVAGFDILYSLQDEGFDKAEGLRSIPQTLGVSRAIVVSRAFHLLVPFLIGFSGSLMGVGPWFYSGCVLLAGLLIYEHRLVKPDDLSKIDMAFFTVNGVISLAFFGFVLVDGIVRI